MLKSFVWWADAEGETALVELRVRFL
eukprot:COSAG04_NODE_30334_length_263_cov_0.878049_1_plen_25_part_10